MTKVNIVDLTTNVCTSLPTDTTDCSYVNALLMIYNVIWLLQK